MLCPDTLGAVKWQEHTTLLSVPLEAAGLVGVTEATSGNVLGQTLTQGVQSIYESFPKWD